MGYFNSGFLFTKWHVSEDGLKKGIVNQFLKGKPWKWRGRSLNKKDPNRDLSFELWVMQNLLLNKWQYIEVTTY